MTLRAAAAALVGVQGTALAVIAIVLGVKALAGSPSDRLGALLGAALALAAGVVVVLLARGHASGRIGVRSPLVVIELLCLPVSWGLFQSHRSALGVLLGASGLAGLVLVAASSREPVTRR